MGDMYSVEAKNVLERLADALGTKTDVELAERLNVATQTISTWKKRNRVPYDYLVDIASRAPISLDSLVFGSDKSAHTDNDVKAQNVKALTDWAKEYSDSELIKLVYQRLNEYLPLEEELANREVESVLSALMAAFHSVKRQLPAGYYIPQDGSDSSEELVFAIVDDYYRNYMRFVDLLDKNVQKKSPNSSSETTSDLSDKIGDAHSTTQNISGSNHHIAGRDIHNKK